MVEKVPIKDKVLLTINEASEYIGVGHTAIRKFIDGREDEFCVLVGNRKLIKREKFEKYIKNNVTVI
ncbi:MAG: helix-turn-helix domain-containing protein [Aeriscardovia sp.]|nr:helix-turn-helix domain-containing protein [Aeriscardovia sp.]MBR3243836.1 helix-turn-helix domain-containing protein [Parasporobacterium sp.]MBR3359804.1 helix-turn-helix domain-containing protein [Lachnospiraceae bacterium]